MRLLSYNIHKGIGGRDRLYRLERTLQVIEGENPDLICLQEVDRHVRRSSFDDQPKLLAEYFKLPYSAYQLNVPLKSGGYGNLFLSRWPLAEKHQISLRLKNKKPRGAQVVVVDSPEGPVQIVNWHLGLAERERHWQVAHLLDHRSYQGCCQIPSVVAGDFNDWRNTLAAGPFSQAGYQHITAPPWRFRSFPAYLPMGSLDKLFCRGPVAIRSVRIVRSPLAHRASDHLPLVADFHVSSANGDPDLHVVA